MCRVTVTLSHARLSLRQEAQEEDAVFAIMLYEENLMNRTGTQIFSINYYLYDIIIAHDYN